MRWGKYYWIVLHTQAMSYPIQPTQTEVDRMSRFLQDFMHLLPCTVCAHHAEQYILKHPPTLQSRAEFEVWLHVFHNHVNLRVNKPTLSLAAARKSTLRRILPPLPPQRRGITIPLIVLLLLLLLIFLAYK